MLRKKKLIGKVIIDKNRPILQLNWSQYELLVGRALRAMTHAKYRPDLIIYILNGGWFGSALARVLRKPDAVTRARSYTDPPKGAIGRRKRNVRFTRDFLFFDPKTNQPMRLTKKIWCYKRVLIIDDLDDSGRTLHKAEILLRKWFEGKIFDIKTLCLCHKSCSNYSVDFVGQTVPSHWGKYSKPMWIDQPLEALERKLRKQYKVWKKVV